MSEPPHKIEILPGQDYAAQFPKTEPEELPPGCILPEELHSIPTLPPTDVELPKECTWIVEPPIPEPYVCVPTVGIDFDVSVCSQAANKGVSVNGGVHIGADPNSECGLLVSGGYEICMCIPDFSADIAVNMCSTGIKSGASADSDITVVQSGECGYALTGGIDICIPCIPTFDGSEVTGVGTGQTTAAANISLDPTGECSYKLVGSIAVNTPCITASGSASISASGDAYGGGTIFINPSGCGGVELSGSAVIGVTLPTPPKCSTVNITAGETAYYTLNLKMDGMDVGSLTLPIKLLVEPGPSGCPDVEPISAWESPTGQTIWPGCCAFKISIEEPEDPIDGYLGFGTADITLCNPDGGTTDIKVLTMPSA
jgi:hypothetical protein